MGLRPLFLTSFLNTQKSILWHTKSIIQKDRQRLYLTSSQHGTGSARCFNKEITIEQALKESGLDFHVDKLPNIHRLGNGQDIVSKESFFTVRTDVFFADQKK